MIFLSICLFACFSLKGTQLFSFSSPIFVFSKKRNSRRLAKYLKKILANTRLCRALIRMYACSRRRVKVALRVCYSSLFPLFLCDFNHFLCFFFRLYFFLRNHVCVFPYVFCYFFLFSSVPLLVVVTARILWLFSFFSLALCFPAFVFISVFVV